MTVPVSRLGRAIREFTADSDDESTSPSEDDFEVIGMPKVSGTGCVIIYLSGSEDFRLTSRKQSKSVRPNRDSNAWRMGQDFNPTNLKGKQRAMTIWEEDEGREKSALTVFLKLTEEKSMVRHTPI
jgi:hypothetical protein